MREETGKWVDRAKKAIEGQFDQRRSLRRRAEDKMRSTGEPGPPERFETPDLSRPGEAERLIHELQVHQIELEMQNDELRRTFDELELSHGRYLDLYDFAPVAYFTLAEDGTILEANLTASILLGITRTELIGSPFDRYVFADDQETCLRQRKTLLASNEPGSGDLRMLRANAAPFWASVKGDVSKAEDGSTVLRIVVGDIDDRIKIGQERDLLIVELQSALKNVKQLSGLLPICSWCKKIRDDQGYWSAIEHYLNQHSEAVFTHGICPDCKEKYFAGRKKKKPGAGSP
ncbi:MAG TPA: PAS domain-containing protein [Candidatus Deferrimicrobiaceae bacterium]